jgi:hypothetical protein
MSIRKWLLSPVEGVLAGLTAEDAADDQLPGSALLRHRRIRAWPRARRHALHLAIRNRPLRERGAAQALARGAESWRHPKRSRWNVERPDVICGGFPCQDISNAGKRAGIDGERSGLWSEYARVIGELRPRYVIVENVAALLGRGLERVLGDLAALGFDAEWHCIPASAVGAPHDATGFSLWPTPVKSDGQARRPSKGWDGTDLPSVVWRRCGGDQNPEKPPAKLNPVWVEWLMGFDPEWTALDASATPSSRRSRKSSAGRS